VKPYFLSYSLYCATFSFACKIMLSILAWNDARNETIINCLRLDINQLNFNFYYT
jgi:hypothetical protein